MVLYIDTTESGLIYLALAPDRKSLNRKRHTAEAEIAAQYDHAEKLLPQIDKLCRQGNITAEDLDKIIVNNENGSFSALRIGVVTANALGYARRIPVESLKRDINPTVRNKYKPVRPVYSREPNITVKN